MKFSFIAVTLLAARASAIPVAADDAAGSQATHGALGLPATDALTGLAEQLKVPVETLLEQVVGAVKGLLPVKRAEEANDQATHGALGLPGTDTLEKLAGQLGVSVEALLQELLGALKGVLPVKRGEEGGESVNKNTLVDVDAVNDSLNDLNLPLDDVLDELLALLGGLLPKRDAAADVGGLAKSVEGLLKELLGAVEGLVKGGSKEVSKELKDTLSLLEDLLGKILKSDNKKLSENTLVKISVLNKSLNNLLK